MALTTTVKKTGVSGDLRYFVADVTFDSSYATGGMSLTGSSLGFPGSTVQWLVGVGTQGYDLRYNYSTSKLMVFAPVVKMTGTLDPASLNAVTARDDAVTVTGVASTDEVVGFRGPDALESKYIAKGARASATDTITLRADNPSAASIDPASGTYTFYVSGANNASKEVPSGTNLSTVTVRVFGFLTGV